jgi:hypothetical protein
MSAVKESSLHLEDVKSPQDVEKNDQTIAVSATEEAFIRKKVWCHIPPRMAEQS